MKNSAYKIQDLKWGCQNPLEENKEIIEALGDAIALISLTRRFSSFDELIRHLSGLTTILCGKIHESQAAERTAQNCPIKDRNLCCAHAVHNLLNDTLRFAFAFSQISAEEAAYLESQLDSIASQLYEVDVQACSIYNRSESPATYSTTIRSAEERLGAERGLIRDRIVEALTRL